MQEQMLLYIAKQLEEILKRLEKQESRKPGGKIGRPDKEHIVLRYRKNYPNASKTDCMRATNLSIKTVSKYWDSCLQRGRKEEKDEDVEERQEETKQERETLCKQV